MSKPVALIFFGVSVILLVAGVMTLIQPPLIVNMFFLGFVFDLMLLFGFGLALLASTFTTLKYPLHFASFDSTALNLAGVGFSGWGLGFFFAFLISLSSLSIFTAIALLFSVLTLGTSYSFFRLSHALKHQELYNLDVELVKRRT